MNNLALQQIGDGREPDVGMGWHVEAASARQTHWAHAIEEDERPHVAASERRQDARDFDATDGAGVPFDHDFDFVGVARAHPSE